MMDLIYRRKSCREFLKVYSEELYKDLIPDVFEIGVLNLVNSFNKTLFTKSELKTIIDDLKNKDYFQINDIKTIQKLNTNLNNNKTEIKNNNNINNNNNNNVYPNWWWDNKEEEDFDTEIENFKSKHNFNPKFKINPNSQRFNQQNYQQENYQQKKYNYPQQNYSQQNYSQNQSQFTSNIPTESNNNNFNNNNENLNRNFPQKMTMKKLTMGKFYNNQMTQTTPQESQIHSLNSSKNSNLNYLMSFDKNLNIEKVEEKKYENKRKF
jgi:hypothetical protein